MFAVIIVPGKAGDPGIVAIGRLIDDGIGRSAVFPTAHYTAGIPVTIIGFKTFEVRIRSDRGCGMENDIEQATNIARGMVTRWGMSDRLGMIQLAPKSNPYLNNQPTGNFGAKPFSDHTAQAIDDEVLRIIKECHVEARRLLHDHRQALNALAEALLQNETLNEQEIIEVTGLKPAKKPVSIRSRVRAE